MAINPPDDQWDSVTLDKREMWGCIKGGLRVFCLDGIVPTNDDGDDRGFDIPAGESIPFEAGQTVFYRAGRGFKGFGNSFERVELQP